MILKETKQLHKAYKKSLNKLQKDFFTDKNSGLTLFVEYIKYLRDSMALVEYNKNTERPPETEAKLATIIASVYEFEAYRQQSDSTQKLIHWNNFCDLIRQNMEDWLRLDDSV